MVYGAWPLDVRTDDARASTHFMAHKPLYFESFLLELVRTCCQQDKLHIEFQTSPGAQGCFSLLNPIIRLFLVPGFMGGPFLEPLKLPFSSMMHFSVWR